MYQEKHYVKPAACGLPVFIRQNKEINETLEYTGGKSQAV